MPFGGFLTASIVAPVVGGIIGNITSSGDRAAAEQAMRDALAEINAIGAPPDLAREILLQRFEQVGVLTPELEEAVSLDAPKVAQIQEAPELRRAQMGALQILGQQAKGGLTAEGRSGLEEIQRQQERNTEAKRQQILQSFQQRGTGGAGAEMLSQLQAASAGAAQAGEERLKLQAQAQQAALQAASQYGSLGGQIRGQEFDIARARAAAEDQAAATRFQEATSRQTRNVASRNLAQQQNLAMRQRISEQNVAQQNAELQRQRAAEAQRYEFDLRRAQARAGARQGMAQQYQQQAGQTTGVWSGIGSSIGQGAAQAVAYQARANKPDGTPGGAVTPTPQRGAITGSNYVAPANEMFGVSSADELYERLGIPKP
jgi:hypothetical protein